MSGVKDRSTRDATPGRARSLNLTQGSGSWVRVQGSGFGVEGAGIGSGFGAWGVGCEPQGWSRQPRAHRGRPRHRGDQGRALRGVGRDGNPWFRSGFRV